MTDTEAEGRPLDKRPFRADAVWPRLERGEKGGREACFAPRALDTPLP